MLNTAILSLRITQTPRRGQSEWVSVNTIWLGGSRLLPHVELHALGVWTGRLPVFLYFKHMLCLKLMWMSPLCTRLAKRALVRQAFKELLIGCTGRFSSGFSTD